MVETKGKWADLNFYKDTGLKNYPKYANGASGYVITRPLVAGIVEKFDELKCYANEDASLGYWLHSLGLGRVQYINTKNRVFSWMGFNECNRTMHLVIGHKMTPMKLYECQRKMDNAVYLERLLDKF